MLDAHVCTHRLRVECTPYLPSTGPLQGLQWAHEYLNATSRDPVLNYITEALRRWVRGGKGYETLPSSLYSTVKCYPKTDYRMSNGSCWWTGLLIDPYEYLVRKS